MDANPPQLLLIEDFLPDVKRCGEVLAGFRWLDGVVCPCCSSRKVKKNGTENGLQRYWCHGHAGTFSVTTGTVFANSNVKLDRWFYFIFHYLRNESAKTLGETIGVSYKTALRMAHVTLGLVAGECDGITLSGKGEFDELYLACGYKGEKQTRRPPRKRGLKLRGRGTMDYDKPPILGGCDRNGHLRLMVADHANTHWIKTFFLRVVVLLKDLTAVYTDEWTGYTFLKKIDVAHETVNHSKKEYARGEVHNNTMEGYYSVYRPWMQTYRGVSKRYLTGYTALFEFVENHRHHGWNHLLNRIISFPLPQKITPILRPPPITIHPHIIQATTSYR